MAIILPGGLGTIIPPASILPTTIPGLVDNILTWLLTFAGAFAVLAVIYSGFMYITAGSDSDQAEKAKKNLTWAIIGVVLVAMSVLIVSQINRILH